MKSTLNEPYRWRIHLTLIYELNCGDKRKARRSISKAHSEDKRKTDSTRLARDAGFKVRSALKFHWPFIGRSKLKGFRALSSHQVGCFKRLFEDLPGTAHKNFKKGFKSSGQVRHLHSFKLVKKAGFSFIAGLWVRIVTNKTRVMFISSSWQRHKFKILKKKIGQSITMPRFWTKRDG